MRSSICPGNRTVTPTCSPTSSSWVSPDRCSQPRGRENRSYRRWTCGDGLVSGDLSPQKKPFLVNGPCLLFFSLPAPSAFGGRFACTPFPEEHACVCRGHPRVRVQLCVRRGGCQGLCSSWNLLSRGGGALATPSSLAFSVSLHQNVPRAPALEQGLFPWSGLHHGAARTIYDLAPCPFRTGLQQ